MMLISGQDWQAVVLTLKLATVTTLLLLSFGTPLAWGLSRWQSKWKVFAEACVALPLVLPPTVLGFYLLMWLSPKGWLGGIWLNLTGHSLAFSFSGLVVGSFLYSLPFVVQPLQAAFNQLDENFLEVAATLGSGRWDRFKSIIFPLTRSSFIVAGCLGFVHTLGEFGVVLMIGGNIPGETKVLSIALFDHVESLEYSAAQQLAGGMLIFSLFALILLYSLNRRYQLSGGKQAVTPGGALQ